MPASQMTNHDRSLLSKIPIKSIRWGLRGGKSGLTIYEDDTYCYGQILPVYVRLAVDPPNATTRPWGVKAKVEKVAVQRLDAQGLCAVTISTS
jgi:hypothetical protein